MCMSLMTLTSLFSEESGTGVILERAEERIEGNGDNYTTTLINVVGKRREEIMYSLER